MLQQVRERLARRTDSEFEQATLRLALGTVLFAYMLLNFEWVETRGLAGWFYAAAVLFYGTALTLVVLVCLSTTASPPRRIVGAVVDALGITGCMMFGGEPAAAFFLAYLWVTLGNGFRYGPAYLHVSLALSAVGFAGALAVNPFWSGHLILGIEMLVGMIGVALYARSLVVKLNRATRRAEAANDAKRAFVSRMSHEMRTPLTSILGLAELLAGTRLRPDQRQMASLVRESSMHLKSLVDDILDFSKIEAGKMELEHGPFGVRALLWTVAGIVSPQARGKGLRLDLRIAPNLPDRVIGDEVRLRQVLLNLAGNAVKFTRAGTVTLGVTLLERTRDAARLRFVVEDTGIGIPADKLDTIFDSFTQADESVTRRYGGTGLGTTIAKQIVDLMGGTMSVESTPGTGSVFSFEVTLEVAPDAIGAAPSADAVPRWILAGFDTGRSAEMRAMLGSWGVAVIDVAEGDVAAARAAAGTGPLSGVFYYARDAAEGAPAAIRAMRRPEQFGAVPVVLCTTDARLLEQPPAEAAAVLAWPPQRFDVFSAVHLLSSSGETRELELAEAPAGDRSRATAAPLSVLVVDDTSTNRFVIQSILEHHGHRCESLASPDEALDRFVEAQFDVVVCDRNMPEMDGIELVRTLRALDRTAGGSTAFVMLTGDATSGARDAAMAAGVDAFLTKPVRPQELIAALERVGRRAVRGTTTGSAQTAQGSAAPGPESPADVATINLGAADALASLRPDDPDFVRRLQERFLGDARKWLGEVRRAVASGEIGPVKEAVHTLEGDAGSLGFDRIVAVCRAHRGLTEDDVDAAGRRFAELLDEAITVSETAVASGTPARSD
jgi:two-component system sensor histidine kinase RpfC